jgi:transcriptional regulator
LGDLQPEGGHAAVAVGEEPYGRMLPGIRGVRMTIVGVEAKFKYDDHNPVEHRERVIGYLQERGTGLDNATAAHQRRRLAALGDWRKEKNKGATGNHPHSQSSTGQ